VSANHKPRNDDVVLVYATFPSQDEAERVGGDLVDRRIVACVNILPAMTSLYIWQGRRQREAECVMIAKTRASLADTLVAEIARLHSYDTPAVVVVPLSGGARPFLDWVSAQTIDPTPNT
jgi:periplasmic divalent cation tolerance protein